jgi:hypothetical protein
VLAETAPEQRDRIVDDWWRSREAGRDAIMIALRRADVGELNERARARMTAAGRLSEHTILVHGKPVAVGDEIVCLRNHPGIGVSNGTQGTVIAIGLDAASITISERAAREIVLPAHYLQSTTQRGGPTLDYAYALTGHKAQGVTVDEALVLGTDALYREWGYVAMSRGRHSNRLYVVAGQPELEDPVRRDENRNPVERITQSLARSEAQISATDAVAHSAVTRMSSEQLVTRIRDIDRAVQAEHRRARRDRAQRDRAARLSHELPEPRSEAANDEHRERELLASELERRRRARGLALLLDPPPYLIAELGPVPDELVSRRRWRSAAETIESLRDQLAYSDSRQALPDRVTDPAARAQVKALRESIAKPDLDRNVGRELAR